MAKENNKPESQSQSQSQPILLLDKDSENNNNNRAMSQLRDSLLSQLTQLNPSLPPSTLTHRSSFIQSRLQQLFHSFDTPTHPPYALMINRAIAELNEKKGSTEDAISEFVKKEYDDLPWAHSKILSLHLKRLCETEEILCNENGRYVFPIGGVEEKERRKAGRKRKRGGNRTNNRGDGERGMKLALLNSSDGTDETLIEVSKSDHHSIGSVEEQTQIQMVSSTICAEGSPECIVSTGPGIESSSPTQVQHQISTDIDMDVTTALVCVNEDDDELPQDYNEGNTNGNLDENPMSECLEQTQPKRKRGRPRKSETDANCQEKPLLVKQGPTRNKKKKKDKNGQTRGPGRPRKINQDTEQCEEELKIKEEKIRKKDQGKLHGHEMKLKKTQAKLHGRGCGRGRGRGQGRPPKPKVCDAIEEAPAAEDQAKLRGRGQGRGRGRGQGRPPKPKVCDTIADAPAAEATHVKYKVEVDADLLNQNQI